MIKFGIIGFGLIGKSHLKLFQDNKIMNGTVTAVAINGNKKYDETLEYVGNEVKIYTDYHQLLEDSEVDVVLITTPHLIHVEIIKESIDANKIVLCEKPLGIHYSNVKKISSSYNNKIALMMNQRTNPLMIKINEMISNNQLGKIKRFVYQNTTTYRPGGYFEMSPWRGTWLNEGGGLIVNQGVHTIDLLCMLFGIPSSVTSTIKYGEYHNILVDDDVNVTMKYENGVIGNLIMSTHEWPGTNRFEIVGSKGSLILDEEKLTIIVNEIDEQEFSKSTIESKSWSTYNYTKTEYPVDSLSISQSEEHATIINNVINFINGSSKLIANLEDGKNTTKLCNMIYLSSFLDREIYSSSFCEELFDEEFNKKVVLEKEWMRVKNE